MNILYVCTPYDVHDRKWMTYFTNKPGFKLFAVWESLMDAGTKEKDLEAFRTNGITMLPSFESFSFKNPLATYRSVQYLNRIIKEHNIDIVHLLFATPHALWGKYLKAPYIITARGSDVLIVIPGLLKINGLRGIQSKYMYGIFKESFNKAALITGTSSRQVESIRHEFNPRVPLELIRTGVDVETIKNINSDELLPEVVKGKKFVFSPRYIKPIYNLELQLAALRLLPKDILSTYKFVFMYGLPGNYLEKTKAELAAIEGLDYVVLDPLSQMEMWTLYKHASLTFMVPHSDGTPNTALEAMAARSPLILRNLPVYDKELFDGTCIKLADDTPQTLADTMVKCLESYPQQLLDAASERVAKYGNRAVEMEKVYDWYIQIGLKAN